MAISIDALLAIVIFVALVAFISTEPVSDAPITKPRIVSSQLVDDAISAMDSTGFVMESIENARPADINARLEQLLPDNVEFKIRMLRYASSIDDPTSNCRATSAFDDCFPEIEDDEFGVTPDVNEANPQLFISSLGEVPTDQEVSHGRKLFVKREPGDCDFEAGFKRIEPKIWETMLFQGSGDENFGFGSTVLVGGSPVTELNCDDEAYVELTMNRESEERRPIDIVFAGAKNRSMGECAIASGNEFFTYGDSAASSGFEKAREFTVSSAAAIDAVLSWSSCASDCPEFFLWNTVADQNYGSGKATTAQNSTTCNVHDKATQRLKAYYYNKAEKARYLGIGSGLVNTGTWELWVKNPNGTSYNFEAKYIDNNHYNDLVVGLIEAWDEPIAKVEIAKVMITEFTQRAEWSDSGADWNKDNYAYGEIGIASKTPIGRGSAIQPSSGMRVAGDIGPPISSQLKNLDDKTQEIDAPAYAFVLDDIGLINDTLAGNFPGYDRTKFAIIYGDSLDDSGAYTIDNAIADAVSKGIFYYAIDFNETNLGQSVCQNQDLKRLADETGGECFPVTEEGALKSVLDIIAKEIGDKSSFNPDPETSTLTMVFPSDFDQDFLYNFDPMPDTWDGQTLEYRDLNITGIPFTPEFNLKIPCDFAGCDSFLFNDRNVSIPPFGTKLTYKMNGNDEDAYWPTSEIKTLPIRFKDLLLDFLDGEFFGVHEIKLNYRVTNDGNSDVDLDAGDPISVNFYQGVDTLNPCPGATWSWLDNQGLGEYGVLDAPDGDAGEFIEVTKNLFESGYICIYLNEADVPDTRRVRECSENNWAVVNCDIPETFVYVLEYWTWEA